jgi:hypothetical protein
LRLRQTLPIARLYRRYRILIGVRPFKAPANRDDMSFIRAWIPL